MSLLSSWSLPAGIAQGAFWTAVAACAVAQLFIVRAVFRTLPGPSSPNIPTPRRWAEIVWALVPMLGLIAVFVGAWRSLPS